MNLTPLRDVNFLFIRARKLFEKLYRNFFFLVEVLSVFFGFGGGIVNAIYHVVFECIEQIIRITIVCLSVTAYIEQYLNRYDKH